MSSFLRNLSIGVLLTTLVVNYTYAQSSQLVTKGLNGTLVYSAYNANNNKVPDFSGVGYMNGESSIPNVPVVLTVYPVSGDNLQNVQNAINTVAAMPADANGIRGAILFKSGIYNISDTVKISDGGIVIRGEGSGASGTLFVATKTATSTLIYFNGPNFYNRISSSRKFITDAYVPCGAKTMNVESGHSFQEGQSVVLHQIPNSNWVKLLHMDSLSYINPSMPGISNWDSASYDVYYQRKVMAVDGNLITLDAPVVDPINVTYAKAELIKYTEARIQQCGIENIRLSSVYASETDNNHGWDAVEFDNAINCWAKDMEVYYFGHSAVHIDEGASWVTVQNCKMYDGKSTLAGGERYSFNIDGQRSIVKNCFTRNGRHDFVTGSRTCGPNVFYNCEATLQQADIGPHQRWSTGVLFDNVKGDGYFAVQNRTNSGSGHGWAGAQVMFWNCAGDVLILQDPEGDYTNWAVGCDQHITNWGNLGVWPLGIVESQYTRIANIPSLYLAQLQERLPGNFTNQTIAFDSIPTKTIRDSSFAVVATSSSGLPVTITSSNPQIASIENGYVQIHAPGTVTITASQHGDETYFPAADVTRVLTIQPFSIYRPSSVDKYYGASCKCTAGNLSYNDQAYHKVSSTVTGTRKTDWYASFNIHEQRNAVTALSLHYDGSYSITKTQSLYLFNWTTNSWDLKDSRSVAQTEVQIFKSIASFLNYISNDGEIRVRVYATSAANTFTCRADWMEIWVETNNSTSRLSQPVRNVTTSKASIITMPNGVGKKLRYTLKNQEKVSVVLKDEMGEVLNTLIENNLQESGVHEVEFDIKDMKSGVYHIELRTGGNVELVNLRIKK